MMKRPGIWSSQESRLTWTWKSISSAQSQATELWPRSGDTLLLDSRFSILMATQLILAKWLSSSSSSVLISASTSWGKIIHITNLITFFVVRYLHFNFLKQLWLFRLWSFNRKGKKKRIEKSVKFQKLYVIFIFLFVFLFWFKFCFLVV